MHEWEINPKSPNWDDFQEQYAWAVPEEYHHPFADHTYCAAKSSKCPVRTLNPVRLMVCLHYDALRLAADKEKEHDKEKQQPEDKRLVRPSTYWHQQRWRASGQCPARRPAHQAEIDEGWLPSIDEMKEAATTQRPLEEIAQQHGECGTPLNERTRALLLQQLQLVRRTIQGDGPPAPVKPPSLKKKLRKLFFG